ncbi:hypothetical protein EJB05_31437, partial [Eragrostis curvula]
RQAAIPGLHRSTINNHVQQQHGAARCGGLLRHRPALQRRLRRPRRRIRPHAGTDSPRRPGVQWRDVVYDAAHGLKARVYRPSVAAGEGGKLPVLLYFHGGGYCVGAYNKPGLCDMFLQRIAADLPAVVLSVQYRLAPEHRLPAAIEDGETFLSWLSGQAALGAGADPWLAESVDFARTFVSGGSAGGNLAHHVVAQASSGQIALGPVRIAGYVLLSPFFGSVERTATESEPPAGVFLTVEMLDQLWRMALPAGATRDHPFANPFSPDSPALQRLALPPVLVVSAELDVLHSHVLSYATRLKEMGTTVELAEFKGEKHGSIDRRSPTMSGNTAPHVVEDFFGVVQLLSDGSVVRRDESVLLPEQPVPAVPGVQWRDIVYDATRGLKVRVYRPSVAADEGGKIPVLVYFHGGGYCLGSYNKPGLCDMFLQRITADLPAIVLSVQYRLAPEHRLPAAIEDGATFLSWLSRQATLGADTEPWLAESADFARTFVSGGSAGANLAHHVVAQASSGQIVLDAVRIAGYVLLSPFFGSIERTATELKPPVGVSLTVEMSDQLWRLALPAGATRDHPLTNPFGPDSPALEPLALPPVLVVASEPDVLLGHVLRYVTRLKEVGKAVELAEFKGEPHGFPVRRWGESNEELIRILKRFAHGTK